MSQSNMSNTQDFLAGKQQGAARRLFFPTFLGVKMARGGNVCHGSGSRVIVSDRGIS